MHAVILQRYTGSVDGDLESMLDGGFPAADVNATRYLDGREIQHGQLAARVTDETHVPHVGDDIITMEQDEIERRVATDFYADFNAEWVGAATSDGGRILTDYLASQVGIIPEDSTLRVEAWSERLEQDEDANTWGASFSQTVEDGYERDRAGAHYHNEVGALPRGLSAVGFEYPWDGRLVRGMVAASGYATLYNVDAVDTFARWVSDELEPYLEVDRDQETLSVECERCGHDRDLNDDGYCITCQDYLNEQGGEA